MRSYIELIQAWEAFLKKHPHGSLEKFGHWLLQRAAERPVNRVEEPAAPYQAQAEGAPADIGYDFNRNEAKAPQLLWRLGKILKVYTKPILEAEGLKSQDEFGILSHVYAVGECTKKQAVETHFIDGSTGIDMIKRLIKRGILTDRVSPHDRRARLIKLSPEGEALLLRMYERLGDLPEVMLGMSLEEQDTFVEQLQQLDIAHTYRIHEAPRQE